MREQVVDEGEVVEESGAHERNMRMTKAVDKNQSEKTQQTCKFSSRP